ncbi:MAG TPA: S8/S53 family peptidase [Bacteroidota bacterium]|nr:S8/S53 family peptidase [Bacteroidota bacterium]
MDARKTIFALLLFVVSATHPQDKPQKYWIYFRDKDESALRALSAAGTVHELSLATGLTERALQRRAKVLPPAQLASASDLPVTQSYIDRLNANGIAAINTSRWFNAVSAMLTPAQANQVEALPFVDRIELVRTFVRKELPPISAPIKKLSTPTTQDLHDYGPSLAQVAQIDVVAVHNLRITGRGILIGMLDSGFDWRVPESEMNMDVIKEYDFVQHDSVTANQPGNTPIDESDQDEHGTLTLSLVGGYKEGQLVSPAFESSFILAKTEYVPSETNIEEDNWVAGIEWEEQNGADVVSSSLGYSQFDSLDANGVPQHSYTTADMNGRTATTTKAAVMAARLGVVVCNAMGNEAETSWHIMISPADADSIISVGAVNINGVYASFSSVGPTADGRTKPDVSADGVGDYCTMRAFSKYSTGFQGTSLSTPLVAGSSALILSAHPGLTPIQVRDALRNTASRAGSPNDSLGWGVIDVYKALLSTGLVLSTDPAVSVQQDGTINVVACAASNALIKKDSVKLFYSADGGASFSMAPMTLTDTIDASTNSGSYSGTIPRFAGVKIQFYIFAVDTTNTPYTMPYHAPQHLFTFNGEDTSVGTTSLPSTFALYQNYPNPFNSSTAIQYYLEKSNFTTLKIYDVLGREVATLVNEYQTAGLKSPVRFDGSPLASGVYFYRLKSGEFSSVKKLVLLK